MAPNNKKPSKRLSALSSGPATSHYPRRVGIYQCPARVKGLPYRFSYSISTTRFTLVDSGGYLYERCALYALGK